MGLNFTESSSSSQTCVIQEVTSSNTKHKKITKAVIIAAGNGSRLQGYQNRPKPLVKVGGEPLLKRVILAAKRAGVTDFVIVVGYKAGKIKKAINAKKLGVKIRWVLNSEWHQPNGVSVLKAEKYVNGKFFLFMSDHVFDYRILEKLQKLNIRGECNVLCVDHRLNQVPNLDDATKVRTKNGQLIDLGKSLTDFNAIDIGIFICNPRLFDALRKSQINGDYSLSGGIRVLAQEGHMLTYEIGEHFWQDVDTIPDVKHAEQLLLLSTRSKTDGIISKLINRRISNWISHWLLKTPITANQISFLNLCFMGFIAWLVSFGKPLNTMVGGILFQLASILDGCDGEVAQVRLRDSKFGAFIDTATDYLGYVFFIIGITFGAFHASGESVVFWVTGLSLLYLLLALRLGILYVRKKGSASMRALDQDIAACKKTKHKVWYLRFFGHIHHLGRRDVFSFFGALIMLFGNVTVFYWGLMGAVILMSSGIFFSAITFLYLNHNFKPFFQFKRSKPKVQQLQTEFSIK